jgi:hypothetical protein
MKKYRAQLQMTTLQVAEIEANSEEEAQSLANERDWKEKEEVLTSTIALDEVEEKEVYFINLSEDTSDEPSAFILCYTTKVRRNSKDYYKDSYEVFCEYDEKDLEPAEQANYRIDELRDMYDSEDSLEELVCWNIAVITQTSEHYKTVTVNYGPKPF